MANEYCALSLFVGKFEKTIDESREGSMNWGRRIRVYGFCELFKSMGL